MPAAAAPYELCREESRIEYLQKRLAADYAGSDPKKRLQTLHDHVLSPKLPHLDKKDGNSIDSDVPNDPCSAEWAAGKALQKSLGALFKWSKALADLAAAGDFDAADASTAAGDASTAAKALGGADNVTTAIRALGNPLQLLSSAIVSEWVNQKVEKAITDSAPKARDTVTQLGRVVDGMLEQLHLTQNTLEAFVGGDPIRASLLDKPAAADLLVVYGFVTVEHDRLELLQRLLADRAAVGDLANAIDNLEKAAKGGDDKQQRAALLLVLKFAHDAAADLASMRSAINGKQENAMPLETTLDVISQLNDAYSKLNAIIIDSEPKTEAERKQLSALLAERDQLRDIIKTALRTGFISDFKMLQKADEEIAVATKELGKQKETIETVTTAIAATAKVIGIVAQIIASVA